MPTLQETHFAVITDNDDPERRGRLKVQSQSLVGYSTELPDWVEPVSQLWTSTGSSGALFLPEKGSTVELIVDEHDTEFDDVKGERFLANPNFKWRPATATDKAGPMPLPAQLLVDYPNTRGWVTRAGHVLTMNDKTGELVIKGSGGGTIMLKSDGSVVLGSSNAVDGAIKGNARNSAEQTFLTALGAFTTALGGLPGMSGPAAAFNSAIITFASAIAATISAQVKLS